MLFSFHRVFCYDKLCNIIPKHIEFHSNYIRIFVPRSKREILSLLVHPDLSTVLLVYSKILKRRVWRLTLYYNSPGKIRVKCVKLCT